MDIKIVAKKATVNSLEEDVLTFQRISVLTYMFLLKMM